MQLRERVSRIGDRLIAVIMSRLGLTRTIGVDRREKDNGGVEYAVKLRKFDDTGRLQSEIDHGVFVTADEARAKAKSLRLWL